MTETGSAQTLKHFSTWSFPKAGGLCARPIISPLKRTLRSKGRIGLLKVQEHLWAEAWLFRASVPKGGITKMCVYAMGRQRPVPNPNTHSCGCWGSWSLVTAIEAPCCVCPHQKACLLCRLGSNTSLSPAVTEHEDPRRIQNLAQLWPHGALVFVGQVNGQKLN